MEISIWLEQSGGTDAVQTRMSGAGQQRAFVNHVSFDFVQRAMISLWVCVLF